MAFKIVTNPCLDLYRSNRQSPHFEALFQSTASSLSPWAYKESCSPLCPQELNPLPILFTIRGNEQPMPTDFILLVITYADKLLQNRKHFNA